MSQRDEETGAREYDQRKVMLMIENLMYSTIALASFSLIL